MDGPHPLDLTLASAARSGDAALAKRCIAQGADPKRRASSGCAGSRKMEPTALMAAAEAGHAAIVELLIPLSDLDARDDGGNTALMLAVWRGRADCAELLLPMSDPKIPDSCGATILMAALVAKLPSLALRLIPLSNVDHGDDSGLTALHLCAMEPQLSHLARALILAGASPQRLDDDGFSPLHAAAADGNLAFLQAVAGLCDPRTEDRNGASPLEIAELSGQVACASHLRSWEASLGELGALSAIAADPAIATPSGRLRI